MPLMGGRCNFRSWESYGTLATRAPDDVDGGTAPAFDKAWSDRNEALPAPTGEVRDGRGDACEVRCNVHSVLVVGVLRHR